MGVQQREEQLKIRRHGTQETRMSAQVKVREKSRVMRKRIPEDSCSAGQHRLERKERGHLESSQEDEIDGITDVHKYIERKFTNRKEYIG
jgi:hypothetical protein